MKLCSNFTILTRHCSYTKYLLLCYHDLKYHVCSSILYNNILGTLKLCIISGVSHGKGQDLFLQSFYESLQLIVQKKLRVPSMHAVIVGSDMTAQPKFESQLRDFVRLNKIQDRVHFVNKTLTVAPYLAAIDVLVQNSQAGSPLL